MPIYIKTVPRNPSQPEPKSGEKPPILIETVPKPEGK